PGRNLVRTLIELVDQGRARTRPPRRRDRAGNITPVRAGDHGSVVPTELPADEPRRGEFTVETTYLADGARIHRVEVPPSEGSGRERGREALMTFLRAAARGRRRVNFDVTLLCGDGTYRTIKVGGRD